MTQGQERATAPYWPPLSINGQIIDLDHLEPFQLDFDVQKIDRKLSINVVFSNHCFTDHYDPAVHASSEIVMDHLKERVFCPTRYGLSTNLPEMIRSLPTAPVWQTRHERNYVHFIQVEDQLGTSYPMFFTLKKERRSACQLMMMVESAYPLPNTDMKALIEKSNKVAFPILCVKVFQDKPLQFNARR